MSKALTKKQILDILARELPYLQHRYGVARLALWLFCPEPTHP